jgi:RNA polymerase sigma-32 factor
MIEATQRDSLASDGIATALEALDDRSHRIVENAGSGQRYDSTGGMTLHGWQRMA